jgi:hypothetical protein
MSFAFTFMLNEPLAYRRVQEISPSQMQMVFRMLAFFGALFNSEANRKRTQGEMRSSYMIVKICLILYYYYCTIIYTIHTKAEVSSSRSGFMCL